MKVANNEKTYRDELVDKIRWAGLELIDRSEDFLGPNCEAITDFSIKIDFNKDGITSISCETSVLCKNEINAIRRAK